MIIEPKREILLVPLLRIGIRRAWNARNDFLRLAIVPLIVILVVAAPQHEILNSTLAGIDISSNAAPPESGIVLQGLLLGLLEGATVVFFAVNWIRQLTLGRAAAPGLGLAIGGRHIRFLMVMLAVFIGVILPCAIVAMIATIAMPAGAGLGVAVVLATLLWMTALVRLSPALIGIAIDAPMPLQVAWNRTAGQGFKLLVALLAVQVVTMIAHQFAFEILRVTGFIAAAPYSFMLLTLVMGLAGIAVQISILVAAFPHFLRETV